MEVVRILDEEGFGVLAGELLAEISLGRFVEASPSSIGESDSDAEELREPIPESEQLSEAVRILRLRLVEPARALAEAERIAGKLTNGNALRIEFVDSQEGFSTRSTSAEPGRCSIPDKLDNVLSRIAKTALDI